MISALVVAAHERPHQAGSPCRAHPYRRFDWQAPGNRFGACHCLDIPFLFETHDVWAAPMLEGAPKGLENETGLREVWTAFRHGERPGALTPSKLP